MQAFNNNNNSDDDDDDEDVKAYTINNHYTQRTYNGEFYCIYS